LKENEVNTEIVNSIKRMGYWAYKIPDPSANSFGKVQATVRPFDIIASINGKSVAIETKIITTPYKKFSIDMLEPHQITNLSEHDGYGFVFLNLRRYVRMGPLKESTNTLFIWDWVKWSDFLMHGISFNANELKQDMMKLMCTMVTTGKKKHFDLTEFERYIQ